MHMNYIKLQDVMTTNEASYRWNINESTLRMRIKNSPIIDELKTQGLIKYFLKPGTNVESIYSLLKRWNVFMVKKRK
jgi:hypothetical protein